MFSYIYIPEKPDFMKKLHLLFVCCLLLIGAQAQTSNGPKLEIKSPIDFGSLKQGEKLRMEITYQNTGNANLVVNQFVSSCVFIKATADAGEIAPGKYGTFLLEVDYSYYWSEKDPPNGDQSISKSLMIMTNEEENNSHIIKITGKMAEPTKL